MSSRVGSTTAGVVGAAAELADEIGFEKLTLSALARRCGVKDPSLYAHVHGLHDLRVRVALRPHIRDVLHPTMWNWPSYPKEGIAR